MAIYIRLRNGKCFIVKNRVEYATVSAKRRVVRHILAGEVVENCPALKSAKSMLVPATAITRIAARLLELNLNGTVVMEPASKEYYSIKVDKDLYDEVKRVVEELLLSKKSAKGTESS